VGKKRKVSKATLENQKAAAKKKAKKQDDDDYKDDEDDAYTTLSRCLWTNNSAKSKPPVGSLEKCAKCSKQFTVVRISGLFPYFLAYIQLKDEIHDCCESSPGLSLSPLHQGLWS
jgi:hypothetical protein